MTPEVFAAASKAMKAAHEEWLRATESIVATAVPPQGRDWCRLRLDRSLYLLVRRKKDGSINLLLHRAHHSERPHERVWARFCDKRQTGDADRNPAALGGTQELGMAGARHSPVAQAVP
jgi:hypothetical protein